MSECRVAVAMEEPTQKSNRDVSQRPSKEGVLERDVALENVVMLAGIGRDDAVQRELASLHPADIAELIDHLEDARMVDGVFGLLPREVAPAVLTLVSPPSRDELLEGLSDEDLGALLAELDTDDATDLLEALPVERISNVLARLPATLAAELGDLLHHPADTAGGIMQTEYVAVPQDATVEEAIGIIRRERDEVSEVHNVFVIDSQAHLEGVLPLRNLVLAGPDERVANIMVRQVVSVGEEMQQDEVARILQKYDLVSIPVTDAERRLVGLITVDDVMDVMEEEATKDIYAIAGLKEEESVDLVYDSIFKRVRQRIGWILMTVFFELIVALVISKVFVTTFEKMALLAAFLPVIIATAGGTGLQSSTLVVRAIALGNLSISRVLGVITSETGTGLVLGFGCGLLAAFASYFMNMDHPDVVKLSTAVFVGMVCAVTIAACVGTIQPVVFYKMGKDPAVAAGPLITAFNDLLGTTMYLVVATLLTSVRG